MKAVTYHGIRDVRVEVVPDPEIKKPTDVIVRVTKSAICGSDLHFYRGKVPMDEGFIVGHEFIGIVEEIGSDVRLLKKGDKVVAPFWVSCGVCINCRNRVPTSCVGGGGCFGFGKAFGDIPGGQAEYVRVPFADSTLEKVPENIEDTKALFLGDIFSTGYFCAEWANIKPGDRVAVFGDGPIGLFATASARLFGPSLVITVGRHDFRLDVAKKLGSDLVINSRKEDPIHKILEVTDGRGVDAVLECIGSEEALSNAVKITRPAGTISFVGLFTEAVPIPMLDFYLKDLTLRGGVCPSKNYISQLLPLIENEKIDPTAIITHDLPLSETPKGYRLMDSKEENAIKVVLTP
ncbi:MAG: glutathione-dependent formaldehyde dehydrogenase [Deltaproteobacteria bacterium]|nr:MAG: glutathione-dependent formaldehyde dehydrogenase [Deltaproteobacteria bacterium]